MREETPRRRFPTPVAAGHQDGFRGEGKGAKTFQLVADVSGMFERTGRSALPTPVGLALPRRPIFTSRVLAR